MSLQSGQVLVAVASPPCRTANVSKLMGRKIVYLAIKMVIFHPLGLANIAHFGSTIANHFVTTLRLEELKSKQSQPRKAN